MFLLGIDLRANQRAIGCSHDHHATVTPVENIVLQVAFVVFRMYNWTWCLFSLSLLHSTSWHCELQPLQKRLASLILTRSVCLSYLQYIVSSAQNLAMWYCWVTKSKTINFNTLKPLSAPWLTTHRERTCIRHWNCSKTCGV